MIVAVAAVLLALPSALPAATASPPGRVVVAWDDVEAGTVVGAGTRTDAGVCRFDHVRVEIPLPRAADRPEERGAARTLEMALDPGTCALSVASMQEDLSVPRLALTEPPHESVGESGSGGSEGGTESAFTASSTVCETLDAKMWMYTTEPLWNMAFGEDWLTEKTGSMSYCYDYSQVWITSDGGGCRASRTHFFNVDQCVLDSRQAGPSTMVLRKGTGSYYQDSGAPPSGTYNHWMSEQENAYWDGFPLCVWNYGGDVPNDPPKTSCIVS